MDNLLLLGFLWCEEVTFSVKNRVSEPVIFYTSASIIQGNAFCGKSLFTSSGAASRPAAALRRTVLKHECREETNGTNLAGNDGTPFVKSGHSRYS